MNTLSVASQIATPVPALDAVQIIEPVTPISGHGEAEANSLSHRQRVLQQVYDAYVEQIYRFAYFKIGNREDAEDITSQVFIKAARSLDITQEVGTILAWLYQVARTTITDFWRSYYKGPTTSLEKLEDTSNISLPADPMILSVDGGDDTEEAARKVRAILEMLPENYSHVLKLRFLQGCSLKETAQAMGITEANAKVMQHRALAKAAKLCEHLNS
jgi:RNA polymerase sigma-70 factor (ECF subfamily)